MALLTEVPFVPVEPTIIESVETYIQRMVMPHDPIGDALHLALASYHKCDFLLTWDVFLEDDVLSRCVTDHFREPSVVGLTPIRPAYVAAGVSEHEGCETERGVFASADGIFTRPGAITHGCIFHVGDRDRCEGTCNFSH